MNFKKALKWCRAEAKRQNISCSFRETLWHHEGTARPRENRIWIVYSTKKSPYELIHVFMHEMMHIECYRKKIFATYHGCKGSHSLSYYNTMIRTALKAERYVENLAMTWFAKNHPRIKVQRAYETEWELNYLRTRGVVAWAKARKKLITNGKMGKRV